MLFSYFHYSIRSHNNINNIQIFSAKILFLKYFTPCWQPFYHSKTASGFFHCAFVQTNVYFLNLYYINAERLAVLHDVKFLRSVL